MTSDYATVRDCTCLLYHQHEQILYTVWLLLYTCQIEYPGRPQLEYIREKLVTTSIVSLIDSDKQVI